MNDQTPFTCKICQKSFEKMGGLAAHITAGHKMKGADYAIKYLYDGVRPLCPVCQKETRYERLSFKEFCTAHANEARRKWSKENATMDYGWRKGQTKETNESLKKHSESVMGEKNHFYGKTHSEEAREKMRENSAHYWKDKIRPEETRQKMRDNASKYWLGKTHSEETKQKMSESNARIWEGKSRDEETRQKISESLMGKMVGEKNPMFGKTHSQEVKEMLIISEEQFNERLEQNSEKFEYFFDYTDYKKHCSTLHKFDVKCKTCGLEQKKNLWNLKFTFCSCEQCIRKQSSEETEVYNYVRSLIDDEIIRNDRSVLAPKELDIYIPSKNFAIEYNGLYWHSEEFRKPDYHQNKTLECHKKGINLFHIFSDEWRDKKEIVKSMIAYRLGKIENKIYARKCYAREISQNESSEFFECSHISGNANSKKSFGLFYDDKLVCALSFRIPIHAKYSDSIEIARFANLPFHSVVGGFSKLLKFAMPWIASQQKSKILSYADLRFGHGNVYSHSGFKLGGKTRIDYWYSDDIVRFHRFKFRAQQGLSERQFADACGVFRVHGCGSNIFMMVL